MAKKDVAVVEKDELIVPEIVEESNNLPMETKLEGLTPELVDKIIAEAELRMKLHDRLMALAIQRALPTDFVDMNGNPYLQAKGAERIMEVCGISMAEVTFQKTWGEDDLNGAGSKFYIYTYRAKFTQAGRNRVVWAQGIRSQRDRFFSTKTKKTTDENGVQTKETIFLPASEVDETDIQQSAYSNLLVNGLTRYLGIRGLTWDYLEKLGLKRGAGGSVDYSGGKGKSGYKKPSQQQPPSQEQKPDEEMPPEPPKPQPLPTEQQWEGFYKYVLGNVDSAKCNQATIDSELKAMFKVDDLKKITYAQLQSSCKHFFDTYKKVENKE